MSSLRYPSKGHLLAKQIDKNNFANMNGLSMAILKGQNYVDVRCIIGTEGGIVHRCIIQSPEDFASEDIRAKVNNGRNLQWHDEAYRFLSNITLTKQADVRNLRDLKEHVDLYMIEMKSMQVFADHIFKSKPPIQHVYPPFAPSNLMLFEKHHGPVLSCDTSPFVSRLFITCAADGFIRLYDTMDKRPVAWWSPSFGDYITCVRFSPWRPCVFAAISSSGSIYIYDLVANKNGPVDEIKYESLEEDGSCLAVPMIYRSARQISFHPR